VSSSVDALVKDQFRVVVMSSFRVHRRLQKRVHSASRQNHNILTLDGALEYSYAIRIL